MSRKEQDEPIRVLRIKKGETLKEIYARLRKSFSAADLQKYAVDEEMFPTDELIAELEGIHKTRKRQTKRKKS